MSIRITPAKSRITTEAFQALSGPSLEGFSFSQIGQRLRSWLPDITGQLKELVKFELYPSGGAPLADLKLKETTPEKFAKAAAESNWVLMREMQLPCPEGFIGKYLNYLDYIELVSDFYKDLPHVVQSFSGFVSTVLATPMDARSMAEYPDLAYGRAEQFAKAAKTLKPMFSGSAGSQPYQTLVARGADWREILERLHICTQNVSRINLSQVRSDVGKCVAMLDVLHERLKDDTKMEISEQVARQVATGAAEIDEMLRGYALTYARVLQLQHAVAKDIDLLYPLCVKK